MTPIVGQYKIIFTCKVCGKTATVLVLKSNSVEMNHQSAAANVTQAGWVVEGKKALCPVCKDKCKTQGCDRPAHVDGYCCIPCHMRDDGVYGSENSRMHHSIDCDLRNGLDVEVPEYQG